MIRRLWSLAVTATIMILVHSTLAFANPQKTPVNPGERIGQWVHANVTALFPPLIGAAALYYLTKRQFTQFLSFAVFAIFVSLFIYAGDEVRDSSVALARWVIGK